MRPVKKNMTNESSSKLTFANPLDSPLASAFDEHGEPPFPAIMLPSFATVRNAVLEAADKKVGCRETFDKDTASVTEHGSREGGPPQF
jgi:hypothetical protein